MRFSWGSFFKTVEKLSRRMKKEKFDSIVCVSRGGLLFGLLISKMLHKPLGVISVKVFSEGKRVKIRLGKVSNSEGLGSNVMIVDDTAKTGETLEAVKKTLGKKGVFSKTAVIALHNKSKFTPDYYAVKFSSTIIFPWSLKFLKKR